MQELIPDHIVSQIFKLNLPMRLIADNKIAFPVLLKNRCGRNTYTIMLETGNKDIWNYHKLEIELKGSIDIESVKYRGEVRLTSIKGEPGYYRMDQIKLYKMNAREYKRVPYRRAVKVTSPIETEAVLMNISASGAMLKCHEKIQEDLLSIEFTLLKKSMVLSARIIEQKYEEEQECYIIRCYFDSIDEKTRKIICQAVKEITLMAKRRLRD